ncbi:hypothetical protein DL96DRAFT_848096 [Flagelloscypha sp. PMI_526]|nr:hypothetical protein DL96DRAFT_848096 [Flagelloscypha sp. PMI_526]
MLGSLRIISSVKNVVKRILEIYTVFTLFEVIVESDHEPEEIGFIVKAFMQRSTITTASVLAILAYFTQASTPKQTQIPLNSFITLLVLCLCLLNKAYFDGLPLGIFKKRVKVLTVVGATALVTLPEVYILLFIIVEGYNLMGLAAILIVLGMVTLHVLIASLLNNI